MSDDIPLDVLEESKAIEESRQLHQKKIMDSVKNMRARCNALRKEYNRIFSFEYENNLKLLPPDEVAVQESLRTLKSDEISKCESEYVKIVHELGIEFKDLEIPVDISFAIETKNDDDDDEELAKAISVSLMAKGPAMAYTQADICGLKPLYGTLENCGASCYMNASLQLLNSMSVFHDASLDDIFEARPLSMLLRNIFKKLENSASITDLRLDASYQELIRITGFELGRQSDASEFMISLFEHFDGSGLGFVLDTFKTMTDNYYIGSEPLLHQYIFNCEYIFDFPSLDHILTRMREVDAIVLRPKVYFMFQIGRFYYQDNGVHFNANPVAVNNTLTVNGYEYVAQGCICFNGMIGNGGHYVYIQFNDEGIPCMVYNDSRKYTYAEEPIFRVENTGYVFLYKRIDHIFMGGSRGEYEGKFIKYVHKLHNYS